MTCKDCIHYVVCWRVKEVESGNPMITDYNICRAFKTEAQEIKHGNWGMIGDIALECNICHGSIVVEQGTINLNYCPNCGAKMDGGRK